MSIRGGLKIGGRVESDLIKKLIYFSRKRTRIRGYLKKILFKRLKYK